MRASIAVLSTVASVLLAFNTEHTSQAQVTEEAGPSPPKVFSHKTTWNRANYIDALLQHVRTKAPKQVQLDMKSPQGGSKTITLKGSGRRPKSPKFTKFRPKRPKRDSTKTYFRPTGQPEMPIIHKRQGPKTFGHVNHDGHRNPLLDFINNNHPAQVREGKSDDDLTNQFNVLRRIPQKVHPKSDSKLEGRVEISWQGDMFFAKSGNGFISDSIKVRRAPHPAIGSPWPLPTRYARNDESVFRIATNAFQFNIKNYSCDILDEAVRRYWHIIIEDSVEDLYDNLQNVESTRLDDFQKKYDTELYKMAPEVFQVDVIVSEPCQKYPSLDMDESYRLVVNKNTKYIEANQVWGALRGLETFSQMVWKGTDTNLYVMETIAIDKPRFPHRGILIDTSRHFIFKDVLFDVLRGMEYNKMNVLHWHMTDDQSFPFQSEQFPELSEKGAYHPSYVYTHKDVAEIIEFARLRGIRIIPEFDVPGHTYAWGHGKPDLIAQCYSQTKQVPGLKGPMDPSKDSTYEVLKTLFSEILELFPDQYIHAGGDEVPHHCWQANQDLMLAGEALVKSEKSLLDNLKRKIRSSIASGLGIDQQFNTLMLWEYFENRFMRDVHEVGSSRENGVKFILWQEASMKTNLNLVNDTIAEIWLGDADVVRDAIEKGYRVLHSACWYLDMISFGPDWPKYYGCDPAFPGQGVDERRVLGGEACLWAEYIDNEGLMTRLWPRASAAAERLWSARDVKNVDNAAPRLQEQRCRMLSRGLSVDQISGPDYCLRKRRIGGHYWSPGEFYTMKGPYRNMKVTKDSVLILVQVLLVLLLLAALIKTSLPTRLFKTVRYSRHSAIVISFLGVIACSVLLYSGLWAWSTS